MMMSVNGFLKWSEDMAGEVGERTLEQKCAVCNEPEITNIII